MKLRKIGRRVAKPVAMFFIALLLSLGLVTSSTKQAEALSTATVLPQLAGHAKLVMPSLLMTAIRLHPVGFAVSTLGAVAVGLYSTQDYWVPYVSGEWGKGKDNSLTNGPTGSQIDTNWTLDSASASWGLVKITGRVTVKAPTTQDRYVGISYRIRCNSKNDGTGTFYADKTGMSYTTYNSSNSPRTIELNPSCPAGYPVSVIAGAPGADPLLTDRTDNGGVVKFPTTVVRFGEYVKPGEGFDPKGEGVNYIATAECIMPDGSKSMIEYTSRGPDGAIRMPPCALLKPGSHGTGRLTIDGVKPDGTKERLWESDAVVDNEHPLCSPSRGGSGCEMKILIDGKECVVGNVECENWTEIYRDQSARVSCQYGPYTVGVDKCNVLERAYLTGGAPATEKNTDGNPETKDFTEPGGQTYQPVQPSTGTGTGTGTIPGSGTNPSSTPGESGQNCLSQGWSWNPVSWVMVPVQCATQWAFVPPRTRLDAQINALKPRLEAKGIQPFITPFMDNFGAVGGTGCKGPAIDLSRIGNSQVLYPMDACSEPLAPIAAGVNAFLSLSIILQGGMSCIRGVAAAFGFNWGFGGKGED